MGAGGGPCDHPATDAGPATVPTDCPPFGRPRCCYESSPLPPCCSFSCSFSRPDEATLDCEEPPPSLCFPPSLDSELACPSGAGAAAGDAGGSAYLAERSATSTCFFCSCSCAVLLASCSYSSLRFSSILLSIDCSSDASATCPCLITACTFASPTRRCTSSHTRCTTSS